jgi:ABC-2 type transport system permease protein
MVLAGVVVLGFGWWPRLASGIGWTVMGVSSVIALFGKVLGVPDSVIDWTPLALTPELPGEAMDWGPVVLLTAVAAVLWIAGLRGFARRDLTGE